MPVAVEHSAAPSAYRLRAGSLRGSSAESRTIRWRPSSRVSRGRWHLIRSRVHRTNQPQGNDDNTITEGGETADMLSAVGLKTCFSDSNNDRQFQSPCPAIDIVLRSYEIVCRILNFIVA